jgi:hypothetical protein
VHGTSESSGSLEDFIHVVDDINIKESGVVWFSFSRLQCNSWESLCPSCINFPLFDFVERAKGAKASGQCYFTVHPRAISSFSCNSFKTLSATLNASIPAGMPQYALIGC